MSRINGSGALAQDATRKTPYQLPQSQLDQANGLLRSLRSEDLGHLLHQLLPAAQVHQLAGNSQVLLALLARELQRREQTDA